MNLDVFRQYKAAVAAGQAGSARRYKDLLVEDNMRLVYKLAKRHLANAGGQVDIDDLVQAGAIGLMRSIETFDAEQSKFSTYAGYWIRHEIQQCIDHEAKVYKPRTAMMPHSLLLKSRAFEARNGREPTADELGCKNEELLAWKVTHKFSAMHEPAYGSKSQATRLALEETLKNEGDETDYKYERADLQIRADQALDALDERSHRIILKWIYEDKSMAQIGKEEKLTKGRVCEIIDEALDQAWAYLHD